MTTALERAKAVLTVWETGRRCFPFTESDTHRYEALRDLIAASEPVLDAEVARMINYYMEMAGSSNGPVEAEICQLTAAMLGRLTTKNARLIAEWSAARERIEAELALQIQHRNDVDREASRRHFEAKETAYRHALAILDTPAAPRADDGVDDLQAKLDAAELHAEYLIKSHARTQAQLDALTKGVAAVRDGIMSFIEERRERGYNNWANGAEACVRILDQHLPPAAPAEGER